MPLRKLNTNCMKVNKCPLATVYDNVYVLLQEENSVTYVFREKNAQEFLYWKNITLYL